MKRIFADNYKVTQNYHSGHGGMDIVGLSSKNIISPIDGVVKSSTIIPKSSGDVTWEWGNYVRVDDAQGNRYFFCHMDSRAVSVGQRVQVGTKLGVMGNTGYSFGAHCHFEVRTKNNVRTNPASFLGIPNTEAVYRWDKTSKGWTYGAFKNDWAFVDGCWYWFDGSGIAATGPKKIDGKLYWFAPKGYGGIKECQMLKTDEYGHLK